MTMSFMNRIKRSRASRWLAAVWHTCIPSITVFRRVWGTTIYCDLRDNIDDLTRSQQELEGREADMHYVLA
ncbi:MAG: hypothetical protein O3A51_04910, partial [Verrucomicrobia bacterium]|nr:hypothetical protein [Verrucomicrobiota bacterium]